MIVDDRADALVLIEQEAHAQLTGELAARLPLRLPHHAAFVAAARIHDNGWREADRAATVDEQGRPHTFSTVPDDAYEDLWRRGIDRAAAVDPLVGLLVGLHGARFFGSRGSDGMRRLVAEERRRQDRVLAELDLGGRWDDLPAEVADASDWIAMLDALSLLACGAPLPDRLPTRVGGATYTLTRSEGTVTIDPWPYAGGDEAFSVTARRVAPGPYDSHQRLRSAIDGADPVEVPVRVAPA